MQFGNKLFEKINIDSTRPKEVQLWAYIIVVGLKEILGNYFLVFHYRGSLSGAEGTHKLDETKVSSGSQEINTLLNFRPSNGILQESPVVVQDGGDGFAREDVVSHLRLHEVQPLGGINLVC